MPSRQRVRLVRLLVKGRGSDNFRLPWNSFPELIKRRDQPERKNWSGINNVHLPIRTGKEDIATFMPDRTTFTFIVEDVAKEIKELKEKWVEFENFDMPGLKMVDSIISWNGVKVAVAWFKDSEGNIIALTEGM